MSDFNWLSESDLSDGSEIIDETDKSEVSDTFECARQGENLTIYDPYQIYTAWMTVPDDMWEDIEQ